MKTKIDTKKVLANYGRKKLIVFNEVFWLLVILFLFGFGSNCCDEDDYIEIADVYYYSMTNPTKMDNYIEVNRSAFNKKFFRCLDDIRMQAGINGVNAGKYCDALPEEEAAQCRQDNWALGIYMWTNAIQDAIDNDTPWTDTMVGLAAKITQQTCQQMEPLIPGYTKMINEITYSISRTLVCN